MAQPPPTVTALRELRGGRVAVELDGRPWRVLPVDAAVRTGLHAGRALDRGTARSLARELRRSRALAHAGRALRSRDLSTRELDSRLERRGVAPSARAGALAALAGSGLVDDTRFAAGRAAVLAARGYGDSAIRHDLERRGVEPEALGAALDGLEPEPERARRVAARRRPGAATARWLAGRGFGEEAVEAAAGIAADP